MNANVFAATPRPAIHNKRKTCGRLQPIVGTGRLSLLPVIAFSTGLLAGCGGGQNGASTATAPTAIPTTSTPPVGSSGVRVISPFSNTMFADREQPVTLSMMLVTAAPTDFTVDVAELRVPLPAPSASVRVQLTPQRQTNITLPILQPGTQYIWSIHPTSRDEGVYSSSATFSIGPPTEARSGTPAQD